MQLVARAGADATKLSPSMAKAGIALPADVRRWRRCSSCLDPRLSRRAGAMALAGRLAGARAVVAAYSRARAGAAVRATATAVATALRRATAPAGSLAFARTHAAATGAYRHRRNQRKSEHGQSRDDPATGCEKVAAVQSCCGGQLLAHLLPPQRVDARSLTIPRENGHRVTGLDARPGGVISPREGWKRTKLRSPSRSMNRAGPTFWRVRHREYFPCSRRRRSMRHLTTLGRRARRAFRASASNSGWPAPAPCAFCR